MDTTECKFGFIYYICTSSFINISIKTAELELKRARGALGAGSFPNFHRLPNYLSTTHHITYYLAVEPAKRKGCKRCERKGKEDKGNQKS